MSKIRSLQRREAVVRRRASFRVTITTSRDEVWTDGLAERASLPTERASVSF
jgi:hypothetical protein